jgi:hypothetical protein
MVVVAAVLICFGGAVLLLKYPYAPAEVASTEESPPSKSNPQEEPPLVQPSAKAPSLPITTTTPQPNLSPVPPTNTAVELKPSRPEPSAYTKRLMDILSDVDPKTPMTPEKAAQWKQALQQLAQEGAGALPAIQQFLDRNQDVKLDFGGDTNIIGESTLRTALIKVLDNIGGPEAMAFEAQWMQSTTDPNEIAMLARQLEKQAPEQYRQLALEAAQAALSMAASGKLPDRDVGPLFSLLQQYGDANSVDYLKSQMGKWKYYGAIALSQLPNGAGVPALTDMVKETEPGPTRNVGFWMLAQDVDSDLAQSTLLDQAQKSTIPCPTWIEISSILAGNEFHIGSAEAQKRLPVAGERSWKLNNGNQNFYSTPRTDPYTVDQISRRIAVLQQMIAANKNCPEAVEWLQKALAQLQGRLAP